MFFSNLVIIDPGWRNLGVVILCFNGLEKKVRKFSSTIDLKLFEKDVNVAHVIKKLDSEIFSLFPTSFFDYLIIEKQPDVFKKNVKLELMIEAFLLARNPTCQLVALSAITVKNRLGLKFGKGNHSQHKKDMVQWASENYDVTVDDHQADCIGLFHVFLKTHKRIEKLYAEYKEEIFYSLPLFSQTMSLIASPKIHEIKPGFTNACLFINTKTGGLLKCHNPECKETEIPASFITTREKKTPMFIFECFSCPFKFSCFPTKKQLFTLESNLKEARIKLGYHLKSNRYEVDLTTPEFKELDIDVLNQYKLALKRFNMDLVDDLPEQEITIVEEDGSTGTIKNKIVRTPGLSEDKWMMIVAYLTRLESKLDAIKEGLAMDDSDGSGSPPPPPPSPSLIELFTSEEVLEEPKEKKRKLSKFQEE